MTPTPPPPSLEIALLSVVINRYRVEFWFELCQRALRESGEDRTRMSEDARAGRDRESNAVRFRKQDIRGINCREETPTGLRSKYTKNLIATDVWGVDVS